MSIIRNMVCGSLRTSSNVDIETQRSKLVSSSSLAFSGMWSPAIFLFYSTVVA